MSESKSKGESMGIPGQSTDKVKSAPAVKPKKMGPKGKSECSPASLSERVAQAPSSKGPKNMYGGAYKDGHPSTEPQSHALPTDSSKSELDGHKPKAPKK